MSDVWVENTLYAFGDYDGDRAGVTGGVEFDSTGNLYGTTFRGGSSGQGTIFELSPSSSGGYTESIAYNFQGSDGGEPDAGLLSDLAGNFYGTTSSGGNAGGQGTVFEFTPQATVNAVGPPGSGSCSARRGANTGSLHWSSGN